ncbi:MAG: (d)CMP kinase [Anaerolineales bacterium]|nr:MAG: (d)CMP kinase [Anaerolineales bacterium]
MIIAVDGPAASGKSTLARRLADALGYLYVDTGVMYRTVTSAALRQSVDIDDEQAVTRIALDLDIDVRPPTQLDGRQYDVLLDGKDITWEIRSPAVDKNVSQVSIYAGVRQAMTKVQRQIGLRGDVVMVGRDIGTVVLPEADLKIYLDASVEARAQRRFDEIVARGERANYEETMAWMRDRDHLDSTREIAPLRAAPDAVILDSTVMDAEQVFTAALALARKV